MISLIAGFSPAPMSGFIVPLIVFVIVGVCLWLIETYVPMADPFKIVLRIVVILLLVLWLLRSFGVF